MRLPNHTQTSNEFIDSHMKDLSGAATKIFIAICRKTIGWHKVTDKISYTQLKEMSGLSDKTVKEGIEQLEKASVIRAEREDGKTTIYEILFDTSGESTEDHWKNYRGTPIPTINVKETNKRNGLNDPSYSKEFEEWWEIYLRKDGKIGAFRVYKTAKKKGATKEMLLMAALCYSNRCKKDDIPVKYIKLPSTFLGRDMHWLEWYRNAEQIRQADEMRKIKNPSIQREQIELTPEQQKKNQEAISEILKPLNVKFGARRV